MHPPSRRLPACLPALQGAQFGFIDCIYVTSGKYLNGKIWSKLFFLFFWSAEYMFTCLFPVLLSLAMFGAGVLTRGGGGGWGGARLLLSSAAAAAPAPARRPSHTPPPRCR